VSCVNWNPIHDVGCGVKGVVGGVATSVFDDVAQDFAHLAEHATAWVWSQLDTATAVRLSGASWDGVLQVTVELGVLVCVTMFLLQIIFSALRQEPGGMGRAVRGVMIAMIGMFAAFIITDSLLALVDSLSDGVMQALAGTTSWNELGNKVIHSNTLTSGAIGSAGMLVGALIMLISSIVVWLALMVRKMLVIISAAFAPIAFGGAPFDVTSAWVRRWIEFTIAMVFSKLILVILFGIGLQIELGLGQVGTATTQEITQMATGLLVMAVAGFAPWLALQFVHWAGGSLQQAGQHARSAGAGAQQAIAVPQRMYAGGRIVGSAAVAGAGAAAAGAGGLAVAAGRLAGGGSRGNGNGNGSSSPGGSNGSSKGPDAGDKVSGPAASRAGGAGAASETAYEAGKNQTGQALGAEGGAVSGGQERQQGTESQIAGRNGSRGEQGSGDAAGSSTGAGDSGAGGGGTPSRGGSGSGEPSRPGSGSGSRGARSSPGQGSTPNPSQGGRPPEPREGGHADGGGGGQGKASGGGLGGEPTGPGA
jgi:hypothetical protein